MLELRVNTDLQTALPEEISFNFEELKTELAERLDHYNGLVVTEDGINEAKADRAKLNKLRTAIDARRKDIKKQYLKPYNDFEGQIKELVVLIDQPIKAIDTQLNDYEERRKEAKQKSVAEAYADTIPEELQEIIPLTRITDPKWLNATTSMKKVTEDLEGWKQRVSADMLAIDSIEDEYKAAVRERYVDTLDISEAIAQRDKIKAAQEAFKAREEARKAQEEERRAKEEEKKAEAEARKAEEADKATMAPEEPAAQTAEKRYTLSLRFFNMTLDQAKDLRNFIDQNGIEYEKL